MTVWVNKTYSVNGESVEVDYETHRMLNALAARFYSCMEYEAKEGLDFADSEHPQEQCMYKMALEAYLFNLNYGLD